MDGMLSQDEINALLNGMSIEGSDTETQQVVEPGAADESLLSDVEKDAIGEVANISMGSSATTLYSLVNRKVNITTPVVTLSNWQTVLDVYEKPCVFILIKYTAGLDGSNILVLKENDVKIITDLMMGGDGTNLEGEIGELHLSAISEAMNQMMGSSATSLSTMLGTVIDISPPDAKLTDLTTVKNGSDIAEFLGGTFVKITFNMQIGDDLVDSSLMQLYPIDFAKKLVATFMGSQVGDSEAEAPASAPEAAPATAPEMAAPTPNMGAPMQQPMMQQPMDPGAMGMPQMGMPQMGMPQMGMPQMMPQMGMPQMMPQMGMPQMGMPQMGPGINVQPAQFQNFSGGYGTMPGGENIGLIMDVPLGVTVELGRTTKLISEILDFAPGTIIELDKIAGEPVDVLVNGKFVARGEVVVIEESFGVRVSEIIK